MRLPQRRLALYALPALVGMGVLGVFLHALFVKQQTQIPLQAATLGASQMQAYTYVQVSQGVTFRPNVRYTFECDASSEVLFTEASSNLGVFVVYDLNDKRFYVGGRNINRPSSLTGFTGGHRYFFWSQRDTFSMRSCANGLQMRSAPSCPPLACVPPPGCAYGKPLYDANQCVESCGELKCDNGGTCGNGRVETGEQCDDGNTQDGDGCSSACLEQTKEGAICGNGKVEMGEECDGNAGNDATTKGCSVECKVTFCPAVQCKQPAPGCTYVFVNKSRNDKGCLLYPCGTLQCSGSCGNGICDLGEADSCPACVYGNPPCDAACQMGSCSQDCSQSQCGNGRMEPGEKCDDENRFNGDGCDAFCQKEVGWTCNMPVVGGRSTCTVVAICGNGKTEQAEQCDDGNTRNNDGCNWLCQKEYRMLCGNKKIDPGEQCDDGNTQKGDGCSDECQREIVAVCGNGKVETGEQCDDGNISSSDGCDATCIKVRACLSPSFVEKKLDFNAHEIVPADFNKDGRMDLVGRFDSSFAVYKNNAGGGFVRSYQQVFDTPTYANIEVYDVDKDGWLDVAAVSGRTSISGGVFAIYINKAQSEPTFDHGGLLLTALRNLAKEFTPLFRFVDYDNDGEVDIVGQGDVAVAMRNFKVAHAPFVSAEKNLTNITVPFSVLGVANNNAQVPFSAAAVSDKPLKNGSFVVATSGLAQNKLMTLHPTYGSQVVRENLSLDERFNQLKIADINGDGIEDIVYTSNIADALFWIDGKTKTETRIQNIAGGKSLYDSTGKVSWFDLDDMDGDGDVDIAVAARVYDGLSSVYWLEQDAGIWTERMISQKLEKPVDIAIADMDNDGLKDVIVGGWPAAVFLQQCK